MATKISFCPNPTFGLIHVPAKKFSYYTKGDQSYSLKHNKEKKIFVSKKYNNKVALVSNSHRTEETDTYLKKNKINKVSKVGSSFKFCLIAEGEGDLYPRFGRTMEWDTAAGQAIVEAAGGKVELLNGEKLTYGKKDFINPSFLCKG